VRAPKPTPNGAHRLGRRFDRRFDRRSAGWICSCSCSAGNRWSAYRRVAWPYGCDQAVGSSGIFVELPTTALPL